MKRIKINLHLHLHDGQSSSQTALQRLAFKFDKPANLPSPSFFRFMEATIRQSQDDGRHSTSRNYRTALTSFRTFCRVRDLSFRQLTPRLVAAYEQWLRQKGICPNTTSCYMRSLRAVYNRAVEQGITPSGQPFKRVYTGVERTAKRSITPTGIRRLQELPLREGTSHCLARDMFLFSLLACGMPFVDMAYLKKAQIRDGYLSYYRHKTGRRIRIKVTPPMQPIIDRYRDTPTDYLFPIIHSPHPRIAHRQYRTGVCYYNRLLKQLARQCDIPDRLTSYASRHSWASFAYEANVGLPVISKALGHATPQTTLIYIRDINDAALDSANSDIINRLFSAKD